jgi:hypothetical protein
LPNREELPPIELFDTDPHGVAAAYRPVSAAVYDADQQGWFAWPHNDVSALLRDPSFKKDPRCRGGWAVHTGTPGG